MAFSFNGNTPKVITFNNQDVKKLIWGNTVVWEKQKLPSQYQEVEYLESTGTQYIDTNLLYAVNDRIEVDIAPISIYTDKVVLGSYTPAAFIELGILVNKFRFDISANATTPIDANVRYKVIKDGATWTVDGNTITNEGSNKGTTYPIYLFGRCFNGDADKLSKIKVYSYKHIRSNVTIAYFIPCYRKIDKKPGLYDLANGVFYTNDGTGEFNVGPDIITIPNEYQRVEYIESSGTQYIDTGVLATSGLSMDERMSYVKVPNDAGFVGTRKGNTRIYLHHTFPWKFGYGYNVLHSSSITAQENVVYNIHTDLSVGNQKMLVNSVEAVSGNESDIISLAYTMYIFCMNESNSPKYFTSGRLYSLTLYSDGEIVRDFVPCYRKADSEIGLYDLVTRQFFTNQGTGTFTKGLDVN